MKRWRGVVGTLLVGVLLVVTTAWAVGQIARDATLLTALCFYIPSPVLVGMLLGAAGLCRLLRFPRVSLLLVVVSLAPLLAVGVAENRLVRQPPDDTAGSPIRVVHWNVMWGKRGWPAVAQELVDLDADAYVLSEIGTDNDFSAFDGYSVVGDWTMAFVARGELGELQRRYNKAEIRELWIDWRPPQVSSEEAPLRVMLVDITAHLQLHRLPTTKLLRRNLEELRPDLVMGDFNTPRRSRGLTPPPPGYRHAYDAVGSGWSYTWPVPAPVLAIDQTLFGKRLSPKSFRLETSWLSDHRRQVFDAEILRKDALR